MTGLIYAAAPLVAASLVARREPAHRPVALALGASALYSVAARDQSASAVVRAFVDRGLKALEKRAKVTS